MTDSCVYTFLPEDLATLIRVGVAVTTNTISWTMDDLSEVVSKLAIAAEDGDREADELATFLLFVEGESEAAWAS
jgi:hypothetical protein